MKKYIILIITILLSGYSYSQELFLHSQDSVLGKPRLEVGVGGWIKMSLIYDREGIETTAALNPLYIPTGNVEHNPQFAGDMKQSRLKFLSRYRSMKLGEITAYIEGDFYGVGTAGFRLRHAYIKGNKLLVGQYWSAYTVPWVWPNVADFDGPPTGIWKRMPQIRFTQKFDNSFEFAVAVETSLPEYTRVVDSMIVVEPNQNIPNLTAQVQKEWGRSKIALSGIYRNIRYQDVDSSFKYLTGFGLSLSGIHNVGKKDHVMYQISGGEGIASFMSSFGGMGLDVVTLDDGRKGLIPTWGGFLSYHHYWGDSDFSSNLLLGWVVFNNNWLKDLDDAIIGTHSSININWTPTENISSFLELQYGTHKDLEGQNGDAIRIMFTTEYSF